MNLPTSKIFIIKKIILKLRNYFDNCKNANPKDT